MIRLTRLNQAPLVLNSDLIEHIEMTPDTVISLTNGQKFMVRENYEQVIERVVDFRRTLLEAVPRNPAAPSAEGQTEAAEQTAGRVANSAWAKS